MKHRLPSAPATDEDSDIWLSIVALYLEDWATVGVIFRDSDRCDADLMWQGQAHPIISGTHTAFGELVVLRSNLTSFRRAGLLR